MPLSRFLSFGEDFNGYVYTCWVGLRLVFVVYVISISLFILFFPFFSGNSRHRK